MAIKLIAKGLPASKDLFSLKEELEQSIFDKDDIDEIFESNEDYNIERSASLYHSINYSYINLNDTEKLAFELLSLFPDGMHMENFKSFCKASKNKENKIGDREIKQLDNKSLLENANGSLKLQSIISRFSDYKFNQRAEDVRSEYYNMAYSYNKFFLNVIGSHSSLQPSIGLKILDLNTNNYLKSLEFLAKLDIAEEEKIAYISQVSNIFRDTNQPNEFLEFVKKTNFKFDKNLDNILQLLQQHVIYWTIGFEAPFKYIKTNYPFNKLSKLNVKNDLDLIVFNRVIAVYKTEGYDFEILKLYLQKSLFKNNLSDILFKLGLLKEAYVLVPNGHIDKTYFDYEIELSTNKLDINEVKKYMDFLYKKESLEMTQMTYLKSKFTSVSNDEIKKLVISNPYTRGLIYLMQTKNEVDFDKKNDLFLKAKQNLFHVKYHYVECLLEFAIFLKLNDKQNEYLTILNEGINISKKHFFRYLLYKLKALENNSSNPIYNYEYFSLPINNNEIKLFINESIESNRSYFKNQPKKNKKNISALTDDFS